MNNQFIETELSYLEYVCIEIGPRNRTHRELIHKQLGNMFQKNQQIRSFTYRNQLNDFIQVINKYLLNLEYLTIYLTIYFLDPETESTRLDHVKHFTVLADVAGPYERLSFSQLDTLCMVYSLLHEDGDARDSWTKFFKNHGNLRINCTLQHLNGFVEFLAELPNLEEIVIIITNYHRFDFNFISQIIENQKNAVKIQLQLNGFNNHGEFDLQIYREKLDKEWHVSLTDGDCLILKFQKKNSSIQEQFNQLTYR